MWKGSGKSTSKSHLLHPNPKGDPYGSVVVLLSDQKEVAHSKVTISSPPMTGAFLRSASKSLQTKADLLERSALLEMPVETI